MAPSTKQDWRTGLSFMHRTICISRYTAVHQSSVCVLQVWIIVGRRNLLTGTTCGRVRENRCVDGMSYSSPRCSGRYQSQRHRTNRTNRDRVRIEPMFGSPPDPATANVICTAYLHGRTGTCSDGLVIMDVMTYRHDIPSGSNNTGVLSQGPAFYGYRVDVHGFARTKVPNKVQAVGYLNAANSGVHWIGLVLKIWN